MVQSFVERGVSTDFADLERLIRPRSIALVGASERAGGQGATATRNLLQHSQFDGAVHLVNHRSPEVFGRPTVASLDDIDGEIDVAVLLVPREHVPAALESAQARGTRFAIVISAGFVEAGDEEGRRLQQEMIDIISGGRMRVLGPNCNGIANIGPPLGLNIQIGFKDELVDGAVGLIVQSGGLCRTLMQSVYRGIGWSYFFSPGNQIDLDAADFVNFLVSDDRTRVIALAMESFPVGDRFVRAAERAREHGKPIVLMKNGSSDAGAAAAASHTGSLVGSRQAMESVARRYGLILVDDVDHLASVSSYLSRVSGTTGEDAIVYGFSGGAGVVVADALAAEGIKLAGLTPETHERLQALMQANFAPTNPVDMATSGLAGDAFAIGLRAAADDAETGAVIVVFNAWYDTISARFVEACRSVSAEHPGAAIIPLWMAAREEREIEDLAEAGLVPCRSATEAAVVARAVIEASRALVPEPGARLEAVADGAPPLDDNQPGLVLEAEGKVLLAERGIRVTSEQEVTSLESALEAAADIDYPVIIKALSDASTHRAGTGLVSKRIDHADGLREAWESLQTAAAQNLPPDARWSILVSEFVVGDIEAYVGVIRDPEWGPMISLGLGGAWIEEIGDASLVPVPTSADEVRAALGRSKLAGVLRRARISEEAIAAFVDIAVSVGDLVAAQPRISELDLNPVIFDARSPVVVDALIALS